MALSRDKGQVKLVAAKMKERAPAAALDDDHRDNDDHGKHGDNDDKSWTMTLAIYDDDDNCSDD